MASCQTETAFELLATIYEDGLEALLSDEFERLDSILNDAQKSIAQLPPLTEDTPAKRTAATAWRRLQGAMQSSIEETREELACARSGKRAARAYGSDKRAPGMRHSSQV